jgi:hypothetical protein
MDKALIATVAVIAFLAVYSMVASKAVSTLLACAPRCGW